MLACLDLTANSRANDVLITLAVIQTFCKRDHNFFFETLFQGLCVNRKTYKILSEMH